MNQVATVNLGITETTTSKVLTNKTIILGVNIFSAPHNRVQNQSVIINVFIAESIQPTNAEIALAEPIIKFDQTGEPSRMLVIGCSQDFFFPCRKEILGSERRIGIRIFGNAIITSLTRVGVLYEEP